MLSIRFPFCKFVLELVNYSECKMFSFVSCVEPTAVMQMLESFFKFVLQDPKTSVTELVRQQLFTGLLQTASTLLRYSGFYNFFFIIFICNIYHL